MVEMIKALAIVFIAIYCIGGFFSTYWYAGTGVSDGMFSRRYHSTQSHTWKGLKALGFLAIWPVALIVERVRWRKYQEELDAADEEEIRHRLSHYIAPSILNRGPLTPAKPTE